MKSTALVDKQVLLSLFTFVFLISIAACLTKNKNTKADFSPTLPSLKYCDLVNNPEKYDGKLVRINAEIKASDHGEHLYDDRCPGDDSIQTYYEATSALIFKHKSDEEDIGGVRNKRRTNSERRQLWSDPVEATLIGIFRKNTPTQNDSSYERNATFHFIVNSIEWNETN